MRVHRSAQTATTTVSHSERKEPRGPGRSAYPVKPNVNRDELGAELHGSVLCLAARHRCYPPLIWRPPVNESRITLIKFYRRSSDMYERRAALLKLAFTLSTAKATDSTPITVNALSAWFSAQQKDVAITSVPLRQPAQPQRHSCRPSSTQRSRYQQRLHAHLCTQRIEFANATVHWHSMQPASNSDQTWT